MIITNLVNVESDKINVYHPRREVWEGALLAPFSDCIPLGTVRLTFTQTNSHKFFTI